jgi:hypothetical protein
MKEVGRINYKLTKRTYVFVILGCLGLLTISGCTSIMPFLTGEPQAIETRIAPH